MKKKSKLFLITTLVFLSVFPKNYVSAAQIQGPNISELRAPVREYIEYKEYVHKSSDEYRLNTIYRSVYDNGHKYSGSLYFKEFSNHKTYAIFTGYLFLDD